MGAIEEKFDEVYRDFETDGVAASGLHEPTKAEIRALGLLLEQAISNSTLGSLLSVKAATAAALAGDLAHDAGSVALVYADANDANNDLWVKDGASGAGAWTVTTILHDTIDGLAGTYVTDAEAAATAALQYKFGASNKINELLAVTRTLGTNGAKPFGIRGLKVPNGASGYQAILQPRINFDGAANTGRSVTLVSSYDKSAVFTRALVPLFQVVAGALVTRAATTTTTTIGNKVIYAMTFTVQGDETELRPRVQLNTAGNAAADETITPADLVIYYNDAVNPALKGMDEGVAELAQFLARHVYRPEFGLTLRDKLNAITLTRTLGAGAANSGNFAITIPNGTTGNGSIFTSAWAWDKAAANVGETARFVEVLDLSATFTRDLSADFQVVTTGASITRTAKIRRKEVSATKVRFTFDYVIQGDETQFRPRVKVDGTALTETDETITLTEFVPHIVASAKSGTTAADRALDLRLAEQVPEIGDPRYKLTLGQQLDLLTITRAIPGGAELYGDRGLKVPNGSTGQSANLRAIIPFAGNGKAGKVTEINLRFEQSAIFTRTMANTMQVQTNGGYVNRPALLSTTSLSGNTRTVTLRYQLQGDEIALTPYIQFNSPTLTTSDETIELTGATAGFYASDDPMKSAADETLDMKLANSPAALLARGYSSNVAMTHTEKKTVGATGADYTTPLAAVQAEAGRTIGNRVELQLDKGTFATTEITSADYVDLAGQGPGETVIDGSQANDASQANLELKSAMLVQHTCRLANMSVIIKNGRYAIHLDNYGQRPNTTRELINLHVEHLGNDDAVNNTWGNQSGVGAGTSSGDTIIVRSGRYVSKNARPFFYHTNGLNDDPVFVDIEGAEMVCLHADADTVFANPVADTVFNKISYGSLSIQPIGSFQRDSCRLVNNVLRGKIVYTPSSWQPTTLDKQPASHAEIDVYGGGNTPAIWLTHDWGRALRIDSATTGNGSSIAVTGSAVKWLFGNGVDDWVYPRAGSPGFSGAVRGWGDISGVLVGPGNDLDITRLGKRLGNCTSVNKVLNVAVDGGAPIVITFDQDYTADTNATIIAFINAELGGAAIASEYNPGGRYRPRFSDEELVLINSSGTGIPMGSVLAFDAAGSKVRKMTSADDPKLYAGVAWQDIESGKPGRVKRKGWLPISDVLRADGTAAFVFGDTFSIDPGNAGMVAKGGAQGLLMAIRNDAVQVERAV